MEEKNNRVRRVQRGSLDGSNKPRFIQEWFYGPYQSLTSEEICLRDPAWLSEAISQKIIDGSQKIVDLKLYFESRLLKFAEINPEFSISIEAEKAIAERKVKFEIKMAMKEKERERMKRVMAERDLIYDAMSKETKETHQEETYKLIGWWFNSKVVKLESGKYKGYTVIEILEKHPEDAMKAFSKAIVNHYYSPGEQVLYWLKQYCPSFRLSDEAAKIYQYEKEAYEDELAWEEHLIDLARERHLRDLDSLGEPSEGSSEDYNDNLDLDQQHPDFYQG